MYLKLTNTQKYALIDDEDYGKVKKWSWRLHKGYVVRSSNGRTSLHREVARRANILIEGKQVDHIDRDGTNCMRKNLRSCSPLQNSMNRFLPKRNNSSNRYRGVRLHRTKKMWIASLSKKDLGLFPSEEEAAVRYNEAGKELYGDFFIPNVIQ